MMEPSYCESISEHTMARLCPTAFTAFELALASAASWLLCETGALGDATMLFIH
jgi:hypothetical protein